MNENVQRTPMPLLPADEKHGHSCKTKQVVKFEIEHDLPSIVTDRVYKYQMISEQNKCQRMPKGQSKMDNPEKLATQDEYKNK